MPTAIDTTKVTGRRQLHFTRMDDILADVDGLAKTGEIRALGNWSPGQVLNHLALSFTRSIDGYAYRPPAVIRFIIRLLFKRRILTKPMTPGFKLPEKAAAELVSVPISTEEGLQNFRNAFQRLKTEPKRVEHAVFGQLTPEEWDQLHCRHSELHLSFLVPAG